MDKKKKYQQEVDRRIQAIENLQGRMNRYIKKIEQEQLQLRRELMVYKRLLKK